MKIKKLKNVKTNRAIKMLVVMFSLSFLLVSCSEEFIEEPSDVSGVVTSVIFENRANLETFEAGFLANYKGQYQTVDVGGIYAMYFARAMKGDDIIQGVSWFRFDYGHENREPNFRRTNFSWFYNYEYINRANQMIFGVENSSTLSAAEKTEFIAKAKFFRGYHMFQILLEFAPNYNNDRSLVRVPVYTEPVTLATAQGNPPVSLQVAYDQVLADLNDAVADLPTTRKAKSFVNKAVAQAILTRVLSVTQDDWQKMSDLARAAYGGTASTAVQSINWGTGFGNMQDQEWLWALFQNGSDETNYYWGHAAPMMDHLTLSYRASYIDPDFVAQFSATDVRNTFIDFYGVSASVPWREFITTKYAFTFASDIPVLRKSEFVLFDAEAQYHLGNENTAQDLLFALQSARDPNATRSGNTGQALLDEILLERKKEFYGEFGPQWFDAKRYRLPIVRGPKHRVQLTVPADSELFYLRLPEDEMDNNPNYAGFNNN